MHQNKTKLTCMHIKLAREGKLQKAQTKKYRKIAKIAKYWQEYDREPLDTSMHKRLKIEHY